MRLLTLPVKITNVMAIENLQPNFLNGEASGRKVRIVDLKKEEEPSIHGEIPETRMLPKIVHVDDLANPFGLRKRYRKFQQNHPHFVESLRRAGEDAVLFYDSNGTKILRGAGATLAVAGVGALAVVVYKHIEKK